MANPAKETFIMARKGIFTRTRPRWFPCMCDSEDPKLLECAVRYEKVAARTIPRIRRITATQIIMNTNFCKERKTVISLPPDYYYLINAKMPEFTIRTPKLKHNNLTASNYSGNHI